MDDTDASLLLRAPVLNIRRRNEDLGPKLRTRLNETGAKPFYQLKPHGGQATSPTPRGVGLNPSSPLIQLDQPTIARPQFGQPRSAYDSPLRNAADWVESHPFSKTKTTPLDEGGDNSGPMNAPMSRASLSRPGAKRRSVGGAELPSNPVREIHGLPPVMSYGTTMRLNEPNFGPISEPVSQPLAVNASTPYGNLRYFPEQPPSFNTVKSLIDTAFHLAPSPAQLDELLAIGPMAGRYMNVDRVFKLASHDTDKTGFLEKQPSHVLPPALGIHDFIPDLSILCYVKEPKLLHVMKLDCKETGLCYEVKVTDPITAIGSATSTCPNDLTAADPGTSVKMILIATDKELQVWKLTLQTVNQSWLLDVNPTEHTFSLPGSTVTCIVGHSHLGHFYLGDTAGNLFLLESSGLLYSSQTGRSWWGLLQSRLPSWMARPKKVTFTLTSILKGRLFNRVAQWISSRQQEIQSLSLDEDRGLLYSLNREGDIQIFWVPPPEIAITPQGRIQKIQFKPVQLLATLERTQMRQQMQNIYQQYLRNLHNAEEESPILAFTTDVVTSSRDLDHSVTDVQVFKIFPTSLSEGRNILATAVGRDGKRLFLKGRFEFPLSPKQLHLTNLPTITNYQYLKSVQVYNWKLPPKNNFAVSSCASLPYTTILVSSDASEAICITRDQFKQRHMSPDTRLALPQKFIEWTQELPLPGHGLPANAHVYAFCWASHQPGLLGQQSCLPHPYDVVGRCHLMRLCACENAQRQSSHQLGPIHHFVQHHSAMIKDNTAMLSRSQLDPLPPVREISDFAASQVAPPKHFTLVTPLGIRSILQNALSTIYLDAVKETLSLKLPHPATLISPVPPPGLEDTLMFSGLLMRSAQALSESELPSHINPVHLSLLQVIPACHAFGEELVFSTFFQILGENVHLLETPIKEILTTRAEARFNPFQNKSRFDPNPRPTSKSVSIVDSAKGVTSDFPTLVLIEYVLEVLLLFGGQTVKRIRSPPQPGFDSELHYPALPQHQYYEDDRLTLLILGLSEYLSRILRPYWSTTIFEPILLQGSPVDSVKKLPLLFRETMGLHQASTDRLFRSKDDMGVSYDRPTSYGLGSQPESKRLRTSEQPDEAHGEVALVLGCRFSAKDIQSTCLKLTQLKETSQHLNKLFSQKALVSRHKSQRVKTEEPNLNLPLLRYFESLIVTAQEVLTCCSLIQTLKQGQSLPDPVFDLFIDGSLNRLYALLVAKHDSLAGFFLPIIVR